jgi:hypothetical protein
LELKEKSFRSENHPMKSDDSLYSEALLVIL